MSLLWITILIAVAALALRAILTVNLTTAEASELQQTRCPICRRNLETVIAILAAVKLLKKLGSKII
jgi:hypothetical protein